MSSRLRVDWPRCAGRGLCHELLPDHVSLDEWGYPVVTGDLTDADLQDARDAVSGCPEMALRIVSVPAR
ncbi:ferredoxin [Nocardioides sp.]|uniref:ferredoxin n=1 Tax=Nocardioides sp. TaxID=35761 RepID=UPI00356638B5